MHSPAQLAPVVQVPAPASPFEFLTVPWRSQALTGGLAKIHVTDSAAEEGFVKCAFPRGAGGYCQVKDIIGAAEASATTVARKV